MDTRNNLEVRIPFSFLQISFRIRFTPCTSVRRMRNDWSSPVPLTYSHPFSVCDGNLRFVPSSIVDLDTVQLLVNSTKANSPAECAKICYEHNCGVSFETFFLSWILKNAQAIIIRSVCLLRTVNVHLSVHGQYWRSRRFCKFEKRESMDFDLWRWSDRWSFFRLGNPM